jgi:hypothetical protein
MGEKINTTKNKEEILIKSSEEAGPDVDRHITKFKNVR